MKASRLRPLVSDRNRSATEAVGVDQPGEVLNYKYVVFVFILTSALSQLNMFTLFLMSAREKKKKRKKQISHMLSSGKAGQDISSEAQDLSLPVN